jgi:hypothetical protein
LSSSLATGPARAGIFALIAAVAGFELWVAWLAIHPRVSPDYRAYYIDQSTTCLNKPVSGLYTLGSTVSFMPDNQTGARRLRVCGWDGPAGDGTHSVGTVSRLHFALSEPAEDLILRLNLTGVVARDHPELQFVVSANGTELGQGSIAAAATGTFDFKVPAAVIAANPGALDVSIAYPNAAEMTPNDSNTHYRAIKLLAVQLRRPGDKPSEGPQDDPEAQRYHAGP